jgi:hypothetical protein
LLFKNQKQRAEERGDKVEKINVVDIHQLFLSNRKKKSFKTKNTIKIYSKNRVNIQCFQELF